MYASSGYGALRTRSLPDLRAPEERLSREGGVARSRAVDDWIETYLTAEVEGDDYGRRSALKGIVDANRADHAAAGVPVHAHPPLPKDFVDGLLNAIAVLPPSYQASAVSDFLGVVDQASRPMAGQQLVAQKNDRRKPPPPRPADPDSPASRKQADDLNKRDWLARILYPIAYGGDAAAEDLFGEDGLFGDWGHRRTIPAPVDPVPGILGEAIRIYLGWGPAGARKLGRLGKTAKSARGASAPVRGGPRGTTQAARAHVCNMSCHCYQIPGSGATCPPFVYGVGKGANAAQAYKIAKTVAGAQVPKGCGYRHCQCRP